MAKIKIFLNQNNCHAEAEYDPDTNVTTILADGGVSKWAEASNAIPKSVRDWREQIVRGEVVDATGTFVKDQPIITKRKGSTSLSPAAGVITGRSTQGTTAWKVNVEGKETAIDDCLKQKGVLDADGHYISPENRKDPIAVTTEAVVEDDPQDMSSNEAIRGYLHQNVIFYGVPGCGKSFFIENLLKTKDDDGKIIDMPSSYYKRILFHPEYTYSDFVGQLRPVTEGSKITYQFVPGPFTEILRDAYADPDHTYFLIIEEINRGNAPAIFGDLFQLLDRKDDGTSEYSIYNKDISDYFKKSKKDRESENDESGAMAQAVEIITRDGIRLPKNLTIFATMNTCDQNVFTLDTAFKRRWRMSRIKNDFSDDWKVSFPQGTITWKAFAEAVNDAILNNCNDGTAAEDKQLGAFFVKQNDVQDVRRFAEKVLLYLWDDVAKYDKSKLFDTNKYKTLDAVIAGFVEGENVFSPNCAKLNELYDGLALSAASVADEAAQSQPQASSAEDGAEEIPEGQPEA